MKGKKIRELIKTKKRAVGCIILAAAVAAGLAVWQPEQEPYFPTYDKDPLLVASIEEEETPLASTPTKTVKTTTSKKKTTTKVTLKTAATKTYTKKLPTTTNTSTTTSKSGTTTVTKETTVVTATTEKYKKKKKYKTVTKTVTTTIKTTTETASSQASSGSTTTKAAYTVDVAAAAPLMATNYPQVTNAFNSLGMKVIVDGSVTGYTGYFNAKSQSITLKSDDKTTIYHELGHFVAFLANNYDRTSSFASVYSSEKGLYTGVNKTYVTKSASEYFAECMRDYIESKDTFKTQRPKSYAAIETALGMITDTQVARYKRIYSAYWSNNS